MRAFLLAALALAMPGFCYAGNPIIPAKGVNDPHIHVFDGKAYLYATHDKSADNASFIMEDWWVWSSDDLVNWKKESVLRPEDTYIGRSLTSGQPFQSAWATDAAEKNGKYYWYFSEANEQTGVVVADSPVGPWLDPLGKPLLTSEMTPTHEYDPGILKDGDAYYIVFGAFNYHIAKLAGDMISLAETARPIEVINGRGPYTDAIDGPFAGKTTDDKPFLHKRGDRYYLSWGAFYALADNPYGPYLYQGALFDDHSFRGGTESPTWPYGYLQGRHGSFFELHGQSYFTYCDISQTGNRYFRDSFISYVHYRKDGTIAPLRADLTGVGEYDADKGRIEAEDFFKRGGFQKVELERGGFGMKPDAKAGYLVFPNIHGLRDKTVLTAKFAGPISDDMKLELSKQNPDGSIRVLGALQSGGQHWRRRIFGRASKTASMRLPKLGDIEAFGDAEAFGDSETLTLRWSQTSPDDNFILDSFIFE